MSTKKVVCDNSQLAQYNLGITVDAVTAQMDKFFKEENNIKLLRKLKNGGTKDELENME